MKPKRSIPHETLSVEVPTALLDQIRLRLIDPRTGIARYGAMRRVVMQSLSLWLRERTQND
jgi:hypothetical protein